jgi:hypothetical protein
MLIVWSHAKCNTVGRSLCPTVFFSLHLLICITTMKNLIYLFSITLVTSCAYKPSPLTIKTFYKDCGDPRWDDCKDVYLQEYTINIYGDTLESRRIYSTDCWEGKLPTFADKKQVKWQQ